MVWRAGGALKSKHTSCRAATLAPIIVCEAAQTAAMDEMVVRGDVLAGPTDNLKCCGGGREEERREEEGSGKLASYDVTELVVVRN